MLEMKRPLITGDIVLSFCELLKMGEMCFSYFKVIGIISHVQTVKESLAVSCTSAQVVLEYLSEFEDIKPFLSEKFLLVLCLV